MQEERDFYKREYELMRNLKQKNGIHRSPPTKDKVGDLHVILVYCLAEKTICLSSIRSYFLFLETKTV